MLATRDAADGDRADPAQRGDRVLELRARRRPCEWTFGALSVAFNAILAWPLAALLLAAVRVESIQDTGRQPDGRRPASKVTGQTVSVVSWWSYPSCQRIGEHLGDDPEGRADDDAGNHRPDCGRRASPRRMIARNRSKAVDAGRNVAIRGTLLARQITTRRADRHRGSDLPPSASPTGRSRA